MKHDCDSTFKLLQKLVVLLLVMIILFFAIRYFIPAISQFTGLLFTGLLPFIFGIVIAILIDPPVDWLVRKVRMNRGVAVALILSVVLVVIILILVFITSRLVVEISELSAGLPAYSQYWINHGLEFIQQVRIFFTNNPLPIEAQEAFRTNIQGTMTNLANLLSTSINMAFNFATRLPLFITIVIVSSLATFFISRDKVLISRFFYKLMPQRFIQPTSRTIGDLTSALVGFCRAQVILISITMLLAIVGLSILGSKYALTLGIVIGFVDLLPVLGPGTVFIPWAVFQFLTGRVYYGLALIILYAILIGIRQLIEPKILSENIGLHPLATLMSLYLGLYFLGVVGLFLGPILVIFIKSILHGLSDS